MSSAAIPSPSGAAASSVVRTFGARPFQTDGDLLALAFAADGSLWSVEEPGALRHWNVATGRQIDWHRLDEPATWWTFSAGARLVAAGSDEVSVWETKTGEFKFGRPMPSWVTAIAFRPDGGLIVTGHDDGKLRFWDPERGAPVRELAAHDGAVSALRFDGPGKRLASAGEDRTIHLWNAETGVKAGSLEGHTDRIPALAWHPDGRRLFSAGWDTTARVWDVTTCQPVILLNTHAAQVYALALSPDGSLLACADSADTVHVWETAVNRELHVLRNVGTEVRCLAWAPDSRRLVAGGADRTIHLWDVRSGAAGDRPLDPQASRTAVAVSPDGRRLHGLGAGTALRTWDVAGGREAVELHEAGPLRAFAASADGKWIAASRALPGEPEAWHDPKRRRAEPPADVLGLWDAASGKLMRWLEGQQPPLTALAFSPDSAHLAAGGFLDTDVWLWRVADGEPALLIPDAAGGGAVEAVAWHPGGKVLAVAGIDHMATGGSDGQVVLWNVEARHPVGSFDGGAVAVAFHPAGRRLAVASLGPAVRLWDVETRQPAGELIGHLGAVTCLAYTPDGRLLATGGDDRTVRLWDAETGLPRGQVELDTQVKALAFSPDGRSLFTGNANTSCYQLDVGQLLTDGA